MDISQFDFEIPEQKIAQFPLENRSESRMMVIEEEQANFRHLKFKNLIDLLSAEDLLVVNDTRVLPARLFGKKSSGGKVEVFLERILGETDALVQCKSSKPIRVDQEIEVQDAIIQVVGKEGAFHQIRVAGVQSITEIFENYGVTPLPPYIRRSAETEDFERYQTVYSASPGAVAAPTAGLHIDNELIEKLKVKNIAMERITLHVGAGTFQPVRAKNVCDHKIHGEIMIIDENVCKCVNETRNRGGRVVAVGTTVVRALESAVVNGQLQPCERETSLFILPGYRFQVVDALITNFHLPRSTLLMMVCAFAGYERVMAAYQEAVDKGYRFYSYGDAMFIERAI